MENGACLMRRTSSTSLTQREDDAGVVTDIRTKSDNSKSCSRPNYPCPPCSSTLRCFCGALATSFYRFLARFSGRRRIHSSHNSPPESHVAPPLSFIWVWILVLICNCFSSVEGCSSRATPKPRPPAPTPRPTITFHTYACPSAYDAWYCLNGATCFSVIIGEDTLYNCECADGYMGPRCEFKDLDGSYLPSQHRIQLETASIAGGAAIAAILVFILCVAAYIRVQRRAKARAATTIADDAVTTDCVDGTSPMAVRLPPQPRRVFGNHAQHPWREHLQRGVNTLAVPMENIQETMPSIALETRQNCETNDCEANDGWIEQHMTSVPGGDRLPTVAPS